MDIRIDCLVLLKSDIDTESLDNRRLFWDTHHAISLDSVDQFLYFSRILSLFRMRGGVMGPSERRTIGLTNFATKPPAFSLVGLAVLEYPDWDHSHNSHHLSLSPSISLFFIPCWDNYSGV